MKHLKFHLLQILLFSFLFVTNIFGNRVLLDTSFNGTGYSVISIAQFPKYAVSASVAILPDGKKIVGGYIYNRSISTAESFMVMRLNANGTLDTSFGNGGYAVTPIDLAPEGSKIIVQPDGKILLSGTSALEATSYNFTLARYNADGSLDTTFNGTGYLTKDLSGSGSLDECLDMALQPDGKIVLVGNTTPLPTLDYNFGIMRVNSDGTLDTTFNGTGIVSAGVSTADERPRSVLIDGNGKIVVGGSYTANQQLSSFLVMRFNSNGSLDTGFGTGGSVKTQVNQSLSNEIRTMAFQSTGKIVAGGCCNALVRYTETGQLDSTFGVNGISPLNTDSVLSMKIASDDKIYAVSLTSAYRFLENGALDTNFIYRNTLSGYGCFLNNINFDGNKFLLGGNCHPNSNSNDNKPTFFRVKEERSRRFLDFFGGGKTAYSLFRPSTGQWLNTNVSGPIQFGTSTDRPIPADYTGDGRTDIAFFRPSSSEWYILRSENSTFYSFQFGALGDIPLVGDFDGDQIDDPGVFRPSDKTWYIMQSTAGMKFEFFGALGDKLVPSDYDGDFKTDIAIYRPSNGQWWIHRSSDDSIYAFQFGTAEDRPVIGDYTGDEKTDAAFWRPSTGDWFILRSEDFSYYSFPWGLSDDLPTPGNYSGDDRFDAAVYRPATNRWYVLTAEGNIIQNDTGISGDIPIPNFFVP